MQRDAAEITHRAFLDNLQVGATRLPLEYRFDPGTDDESAVPAHLRMKFRVVNDQGQPIASDDNLLRLRKRYGGAGQQVFAAAMRAGLRRLLMLHPGVDLRRLRKGLSGLDRMCLQYAKAPQPQGQGQTPRIRKQLADITQASRIASVEDMRGHLDVLIFCGFLQQIPHEHLQDYPRYLKALAVRAEKLPYAAAKDRQGMQEMAAIQHKWQERTTAAREAEWQDTRLEEIRWLLEELRISLYPISVKGLPTAIPKYR